jgi:hypothetical protein
MTIDLRYLVYTAMPTAALWISSMPKAVIKAWCHIRV